MFNKKFYVICDNIRSLENIGSIFRTSDGLIIDKIFLCGICGTPPSQKISKTALGAEENIPWEYHFWTWKIIEKLKKEKVKIVVLEQKRNATCLEKFKPEFPLALVIGNEIKGVSESVLKRADKIVYIPMLGKKESFNVSVAFAIAAYKINTYRINYKKYEFSK
ncbi:TrmH family RNA methyltransferase [bacterium]|nr:TrmH family RNA methyltransferase [bacterium]